MQLMEEILHHLGHIKHCPKWDIYHINWFSRGISGCHQRRIIWWFYVILLNFNLFILLAAKIHHQLPSVLLFFSFRGPKLPPPTGSNGSLPKDAVKVVQRDAQVALEELIQLEVLGDDWMHQWRVGGWIMIFVWGGTKSALELRCFCTFIRIWHLIIY